MGKMDVTFKSIKTNDVIDWKATKVTYDEREININDPGLKDALEELDRMVSICDSPRGSVDDEFKLAAAFRKLNDLIKDGHGC